MDISGVFPYQKTKTPENSVADSVYMYPPKHVKIFQCDDIGR